MKWKSCFRVNTELEQCRGTFVREIRAKRKFFVIPRQKTQKRIFGGEKTLGKCLIYIFCCFSNSMILSRRSEPQRYLLTPVLEVTR